MKLYKFFNESRNRMMVTTDADGGNLPGEAEDWQFQNTVEVERGGRPHIGFPNDQILDAIEKIGYFPPDTPET